MLSTITVIWSKITSHGESSFYFHRFLMFVSLIVSSTDFFTRKKMFPLCMVSVTVNLLLITGHSLRFSNLFYILSEDWFFIRKSLRYNVPRVTLCHICWKQKWIAHENVSLCIRWIELLDLLLSEEHWILRTTYERLDSQRNVFRRRFFFGAYFYAFLCIRM